MKHNIKRFIALLCMITCIALLSGCSAQKEDTSSEIDAAVEETLKNASEQILNEYFSVLTDEQVELELANATKVEDTVFESGLTSWINVKDELGALVSIDSSSVRKSDNGYIVETDATYEKRKIVFNVGVDEDITAYTSFSFSPEYSIGEKLEKAGMNTLMGMGTVFLVLIFISIIISLFKHINTLENIGKNKIKENNSQVNEPVSVKNTSAENTNISDDLELVAVITAAIAASTGASADSLVVRSIKRTTKSTWKKA